TEEESVDSVPIVDPELILIYVTAVVLLGSLLTLIVCFLATRRKHYDRDQDSPVRTRSRDEESAAAAVTPRRTGVGANSANDGGPGHGVAGSGGENPAYTRTSDEVSGLFSVYHSRLVNSLTQGNGQIGQNPGPQWSSPQQQPNVPEMDGGFRQVTLPPNRITEAAPGYYPGSPPPSPPPLHLPRNQGNVQSRDPGRNEMLDPCFLASAPPPYTRYAEDYPTSATLDTPRSAPVGTERSYRLGYEYF
ncbi:uncharacterized protein LOC115220017, partial [Argonauta hians]